jgi:nucleoside-diphosphate-sugar epimerase
VPGNDVNGIVIRPSMLYGKGGSLFSSVFQSAVEAAKKGESFQAVSHPNTRYSTIHTDDLADLYLRVAERVCHVTVLVARS